jgi:muramidase (phage lysozyme)
MSDDTIFAALEQRNLKAFLRVLRQFESSQDDSAYWMISGGGKVPNLDGHPWHGIPTTKGAKACGAYQFLGTTWGSIADKHNVRGFGPAAQDFCAAALIEESGTMPMVLAGNLRGACERLKKIWVSLPGGSENAASNTYERALKVYKEWGGKLDVQPAAPIEERDTSGIPPRVESPVDEKSSFDWGTVAQVGGAIASLFNPLVGAAISAFSPLLQSKIETTLTKQTDPVMAKQIAQNLTDVIGATVQKATGVSDPFQAVVAMQKSPEVIAKVEAAVVSRLDQMAPFLDKLHEQSKDEWKATEESMNNSVARTKESAIGALVQKSIMFFGEATVLLAMVFTGSLIAYQMYKNDGAEPSGQLMILFAMLVTMSANTVRTIADWAFGSSKNSAAKDLTLSEFARK